ncbi:hypothetical protein L1785_04835 [Antribacter sp. KLBMP9083]|uniref:Uncharacterized protein n=1 Tax=Antribacter soli TaxID=2910976 RepID=A0AA41U6H3_9MICO|nr:hypothetical protein [Antribacter soli]MCF4120300.1 hypothetical protein [Antribacter soli]
MEAGTALAAARERFLAGTDAARVAAAVEWDSAAAALFRDALVESSVQVAWEDHLLDEALCLARAFEAALGAAPSPGLGGGTA